uniref:Ras-GAP domain-containing protein n=2 Tax=Bursaphelenchus xylophilus TaxID=6326 RepID=A0A1I7SK67_BURXY
MKYITTEMFDESVISRIERSASLLSVLSMLYQQVSRDWIQKALFHCIELTSRTVATNVHQRVWNLVHEDNPKCDRKLSNISDEVHVLIIQKTQPQLVKLLKLGFSVLNEGSDEYICLQKIEQCLTIISYIQEELETFKELYKDLKNPVRDMTFDRRKLEDVQGIVRTLWHSFEE